MHWLNVAALCTHRLSLLPIERFSEVLMTGWFGRAYLAALAAVDAVVEARGLVAAHPAQHAVVPVKFWGTRIG